MHYRKFIIIVHVLWLHCRAFKSVATIADVTRILSTLSSQFDISFFLDAFLDRLLTLTVEQKVLDADQMDTDSDDVTDSCALLESVIKTLTLSDSTAQTICR